MRKKPKKPNPKNKKGRIKETALNARNQSGHLRQKGRTKEIALNDRNQSLKTKY